MDVTGVHQLPAFLYLRNFQQKTEKTTSTATKRQKQKQNKRAKEERNLNLPTEVGC